MGSGRDEELLFDVIASDAKQSHKTVIASSLCSSQ
jgi:hypothetical protein